MPVVAIAGGTGNLGRALVEAILAKGGSEVIVLARKVCWSCRRLRHADTKRPIPRKRQQLESQSSLSNIPIQIV